MTKHLRDRLNLIKEAANGMLPSSSGMIDPNEAQALANIGGAYSHLAKLHANLEAAERELERTQLTQAAAGVGIGAAAGLAAPPLLARLGRSLKGKAGIALSSLGPKSKVALGAAGILGGLGVAASRQSFREARQLEGRIDMAQEAIQARQGHIKNLYSNARQYFKER